MKKVIIGIIVVCIVVLIGVGVFFHHKSTKIIYNDSYVNGNTAGNLYNSGIFCENNGTVFFANPDDGMRLYSMDVNGSNVQKLSNDVALYINADDNYVYYIRNNRSLENFNFFVFDTNSLCRISRKGGKSTVLDSDPCMYASLIGNSIYYLHNDDADATTLYKIGIDRTDRKQLKKSYAFTCSSLGQYFYYNGESDGKLYRFDTATDSSSMIYDCNCYKPIVTGEDNVYYMDVDQDNRLVHTNISSDVPTTLTEDSVDCYNVYGSYVYYQRYNEEEGNALCMIKNDGTEQKVLASGNFMNINVTSYYIYFMDFQSHTIYYTPTSNPGDISEFHPGIDD